MRFETKGVSKFSHGQPPVEAKVTKLLTESAHATLSVIALTNAVTSSKITPIDVQNEGTRMGTMKPDELAHLWRQEQLTAEMAIGHITQNLVQLHSALEAQRQLLQASLEQQRQLLLALQSTLPAPTKAPSVTKKQKR